MGHMSKLSLLIKALLVREAIMMVGALLAASTLNTQVRKPSR